MATIFPAMPDGSTAAAKVGVIVALVLSVGGAALAQPADLPVPAASTNHYPPGVHVITAPEGAVYADDRGHVLYGMDMRTVLRWSPDAAQYCIGECAKEWEPLLAPAGTQPNISFPVERDRRGERGAAASKSPWPQAAAYTQRDAPDWTVIAGPQGPQWVYKGWHLVFIHRGDRPGSTALDGALDKTFNTLKFVPPVPEISAPTNVQPILLGGAYVLADGEGRVLFTGKCAKDCAAWRPFGAGMASSPIGAWAVKADVDSPQWTYRGQPVFVSQEDDPTAAPASGKPLRP